MFRKVVPSPSSAMHALRLSRQVFTSPILAVKGGPDLNRKAKESDSFAMTMFRGKLRNEAIFPFPKVLTAEQEDEMKLIVEPITKFVKEVNDPWKNDQLSEVDAKTLDGFKELGAFGLQTPPEYGGIGLSNVQYARLTEILGENDLAIGIVLGAHQSIGFKGIILFGTEEQKKKYLPALASGEKMACYCLTEPSSGSDASSIQSKAELSADGKHYILNGNKIWISNGGQAEVFTVFAQTPVKDEKTGTVKNKVTAFIVERGFGGLTSGPPEKKMGIKASNTAALNFDNVKIPVENVLGEVGNGFKVAVQILNAGRFGMAAAMAGTMKYAIEKSTDFANQRIQFGRKICEYGHVQERLARMALLQYSTEAVAYHVAGTMDRGGKEFQLEAAISKVYGSECAWFVVDEAIQLHGGMGFMAETGLEKVLRDLRIFRIFEGANDVLRLFIALTGMQHAGGFLKELAGAMKSPLANFSVLAGEGKKRAKRVAGIVPGDVGDASQFVTDELKSSAKLLNSAVDRFGATVQGLLIRHGKGIINRQLELIRLADAAIQIYAISCVLSRATMAVADNSPTAENEVLMAELFCARAMRLVDDSLKLASGSVLANESKKIAHLSEALISAQGLIHRHTLGF